MSKPIIKVENLVKRYKKAEVNAVDNISFEVAEGEFFAFLGSNGAGKTTTISILTTLLAKSGGEVNIAGYDIDTQSSEVRRNIGIIFQNPSLDLNLTAEENIRFHALMYGLYAYRPTFSMMPKEYKDQVIELATILGIQDAINEPVKTLSGGMKRKLEILRSLMHKPKVLFLDEPTTGLDPQSRTNLWEYIKQVRKDYQTTVFLTTHYLDEAEGADKVAIISKGRIVENAKPAELKKRLLKESISFKAEEKYAEKIRQFLSGEKYSYIQTDKTFNVELKDSELQEILIKIGANLTDIEVHQPTLEQAYLQIIEKDDADNE